MVSPVRAKPRPSPYLFTRIRTRRWQCSSKLQSNYLLQAMQGNLFDFVKGWMLIPWRIMLEIYNNIYRPITFTDEGECVSGMDVFDRTVEQREKRHWTTLAETWWNPEGEFALLRGFNSTRIPFIITTYHRLLRHESPGSYDCALPLQGLKVIDVGCGSGLVAEPLAEMGADVTGVDMVPEIIQIAKTHWSEAHGEAGGPEYLCIPVEELAKSRAEQYDMVLCLEVTTRIEWRGCSAF